MYLVGLPLLLLHHPEFGVLGGRLNQDVIGNLEKGFEFVSQNVLKNLKKLKSEYHNSRLKNEST